MGESLERQVLGERRTHEKQVQTEERRGVSHDGYRAVQQRRDPASGRCRHLLKPSPAIVREAWIPVSDIELLRLHGAGREGGGNPPMLAVPEG